MIAILGEYDALPGLSQENVPERKPRPGVAAGHGCGHHLFGVASASACLALAEQIAVGRAQGNASLLRLPGRGGGSAKAFMVRAGLFNDCDAVLHWHPASRNSAGDESSQARIAAKFRFRGKSAHAAGAPEQGRSALDAVELTNHARELLREHTPDFTRIHHVITAGGSAPNVVPDFAEAFLLHPPPAIRGRPHALSPPAQVRRGRRAGHRDRARDRVPGRHRRDPSQRNAGARRPQEPRAAQ